MTHTGRRMALVGLLALLAAMFPLTGASAQGGDVTLDLEGESNVEYAIAWSQQAYPAAAIDAGDGPTRALIGRDDLFPDNLASGALQDTSPLLLTATEELSVATMTELNRLGVTDVTILGDSDAVDPKVEDQLNEQGFNVDRLGGLTRIETAIAIAQDDTADTSAVEETPDTTAILARAYPSTEDGTQAFADSLAAGAWAAADGYDVLLTESDVLTGNTADYLAEAGYETIFIVGGTEAISEDVEAAVTELADTVTRVSGPTRFETAVAIANERGFADSSEADVTLLVDGQAGDAWADGFPAANLAAMGDYPVVLANSAATSLPEATTEFLVDDGTDFAAHLSNVDVICGSSVPDNADDNNQCVEAAEETGTTVVTVPLLGDGGDVETGTITAVDTANDTVTFVDDGGTETTADFDEQDDTFVVDDTVVTAAEFEAAADIGDTITVIDNGDASSTFALDNAVP
jgi:putative cell wall-binding protein